MHRLRAARAHREPRRIAHVGLAVLAERAEALRRHPRAAPPAASALLRQHAPRTARSNGASSTLCSITLFRASPTPEDTFAPTAGQGHGRRPRGGLSQKANVSATSCGDCASAWVPCPVEDRQASMPTEASSSTHGRRSQVFSSAECNTDRSPGLYAAPRSTSEMLTIAPLLQRGDRPTKCEEFVQRVPMKLAICVSSRVCPMPAT